MAPIRKLLVANRGEVARRVFRTAGAMGIPTVAVFSDPDEDAPFVAEADEAVRLPGAAAHETYLAPEALVGAAARTGADAVHPGYGFLAESAAFARACRRAGLAFVGPEPDVIETMGSKTAAKQVAAKAGVPVLDDLVVAGSTRAADLEAWAEARGGPLLVKADAGGGGRGMRVVGRPDQLPAAVAAARREALAGFGDGTVFVEPFVAGARHVEVQILGDHHGGLVHLFERECSIQRRYQKVIEEAPSPAVGADLRERICAAALAIGREVGYSSLGTVELIVAPGGRFWFIEMNTRLQVEHPVTEMVCGLDLVGLQIAVAEGAPLPREVLAAQLRGHAIEARLYAEDVAAGFMPASGRLERFRVPAGDGMRVEAAYAEGNFVSTHYDGLLAKVVSWAPQREDAARRLARCLERSELHGVATNRDLLVGTLRAASFLAGDADTSFYEVHDPGEIASLSRGEEGATLNAAAAALALLAGRDGSPLPAGIPTAWRNVPGPARPVRLEADGARFDVAVSYNRPGPSVAVNGATLAGLRVLAATAHGVVIEASSERCEVRVVASGDQVFVDGPFGSSDFHQLSDFPQRGGREPPGSLRAPLPGIVRKVHAEPGDEVARGDALVVIEAMKMEHTVHAPRNGTVGEVPVAEGDQVGAGAVLVVLREGDDR